MNLSRVASSIAESPTLKLNAEATRLREQGEPVINLGIGEPQNLAPRDAIASAVARLNSGSIKYTAAAGVPSLKKAIIRYTEENYGRSVSPKNVIVTSGAKHGLYNILYSIVNPGDEVIILAPYWVSYPEMVKMVYGTPVFVKPADGGVYPRLSEIEHAVSPRTRAIIVNSPNNPSGVIYPPEFVSAVVDFCERNDIWLIADDIYHKLVFDGKSAPSCFRYTAKDIEETRIIVVNGVSKSYGMTGFRIGWVVANGKLVQIMNNVQGNATSGTSIVLQTAAEGALNGAADIVESLRSTIESNRDVAMKELSTLDRLRTTRPEGTFYVFPDFSAYQADSVKLSEFLLKKALVVTVPGKEFGMEGHLRLSYAGATRDVAEGIARIRWALDARSPAAIDMGDKQVVRNWL